MGAAEEAAAKAIYRFYDALEDLLQGRGAAAMRDAWHHTDYVTTAHPFGDWARGWNEVWAAWEEGGGAVFSCYTGHRGKNERIAEVKKLNVAVQGDQAFGAVVFHSKLYMSDCELTLNVNCTNVVHKLDGAWKIVHHHADQAPADWQARIGRMVQEGHS
jgi:ketosteroid isomerase-like protein